MSRFYNLLGAVPLVVWYVWGLSEQIPVLIQNFCIINVSTHVGALFALQVIAQASSIAFTSFLIVLLIVRDIPRTQTRGFTPYAAAMCGTFAATSFSLLPPAPLTAQLFAIAGLCTVAGLGLSIYALVYLGRSFAILPSARALVTDGPYRFVRHPLYLFEEIAVVGIMLQFAQPWSFFILVAHLAAQLARMHYEEQTLTQTFPEYSTYASHTARLIPGVY